MIAPIRLESTPCTVSFDGGELTGDAGLVLLAEVAGALGLREALAEELPSHPLRDHDDADLVWQKALLLASGHARDDDATTLRADPAFALCCGGLASQATFSRRFSAFGAEEESALLRALDRAACAAAALGAPADSAVLDLDTTLLAAHGSGQEGAAWNPHYGGVGYHPCLATDTARRDVVAFELRPGAQYCSRGSGEFARRALAAMARRRPGCALALRADSGFAAPEVYEAAEAAGAMYAVRLKENAALRDLAEPAASCLEPGVEARATCSFEYAAASWDRPRRVVCECSMSEGELLPRHMFVVTNMASRPSLVLDFYRGRGEMEQVVGDLKLFMRGCVASASMAANSFRCQVAVLAYSLVNWAGRLALSSSALRRARPATLLREVVRVAGRLVRHAGRAVLRLPSSYPHARALRRALAECAAASPS